MTFAPPPADWIDSGAQPIRGLDLLGLRLPVQRFGLAVLSGVTTISPTIRYLSLRCWIIRTFEQSGLPANSDSLSRYASVIEAAIVLGNLHIDRSATGLIGSDEARNQLDNESDPISLKRLVSQLALNVYAGPSEELGLSFVSDSDLPAITKERGLLLADAVEACIGDTQFVRSLRDTGPPESVTRAVLSELGDAFSFQAIPDQEKKLLCDVLLPNPPRKIRGVDESARLATYTVLLELASELGRAPVEADLFDFATRHEPPPAVHLHSVADGWACYAIRDLIATVHEAALAAIVNSLPSSGSDSAYVDSNVVISGLLRRRDELEAPLRVLELASDGEDLDSITIGQLEARIAGRLGSVARRGGLVRWEGGLDEQALIKLALSADVGALSLLPVAWLLAKRRLDDQVSASDAVVRLSAAPPSHAASLRRIGIGDTILPLLTRWGREHAPVPLVIAQIAELTVEQHLRVAWARFAHDTKKDVALLFTDGPRWRSRREFRNGRTASRLRQAIGWLQQLALLGPNGITEEGLTVLKSAHRTLETRFGEEK